MAIKVVAFYLCCLWNVAPAGGIAGTTEVVLDAVLEDVSVMYSAPSIGLFSSICNTKFT